MFDDSEKMLYDDKLQYKLVKIINESGAFGDIYLSKNLEDNNLYAIKFMKLRKELKLKELLQENEAKNFEKESKSDKILLENDFKILVEESKQYKLLLEKEIKKLQNEIRVDKFFFENEIKILETLSKKNNKNKKYLPKLYAQGTGIVKEKEENEKKEEEKEEKINKEPLKRRYFVMDYYEKGSLTFYVINNKGFEEIFVKIIFKKILKGIKFCHENNICHLDIKTDNILLDDDFNPIIIDFGLSDYFDPSNEIPSKYQMKRGTKLYYWPPEFFQSKIFEYSGVKVDIFSLGVVLFNLVTGIHGFNYSNKEDDYKYIIEGKDDLYWNSIKSKIAKEFSAEFKKLYIKMISPDPKSRPSIDEIFEDPWFKEINDLKKTDKEKYRNLKSQMREKLMELESELNGEKTKDNSEGYEIELNKDEDENIQIPKGEEETNEHFKLDMKPKNYNKNEFANNCMKIKGYLQPAKFMNSLIDCINQDLDTYIEPSSNHLEFEAIFDFGGSNIKNDEDIEQRIIGTRCVIQISLVKIKDNEHLVQFLKKEGQTEDYYKNFLQIKEIIKNI